MKVLKEEQKKLEKWHNSEWWDNPEDYPGNSDFDVERLTDSAELSDFDPTGRNTKFRKGSQPEIMGSCFGPIMDNDYLDHVIEKFYGHYREARNFIGKDIGKRERPFEEIMTMDIDPGITYIEFEANDRARKGDLADVKAVFDLITKDYYQHYTTEETIKEVQDSVLDELLTLRWGTTLEHIEIMVWVLENYADKINGFPDDEQDSWNSLFKEHLWPEYKKNPIPKHLKEVFLARCEKYIPEAIEIVLQSINKMVSQLKEESIDHETGMKNVLEGGKLPKDCFGISFNANGQHFTCSLVDEKKKKLLELTFDELKYVGDAEWNKYLEPLFEPELIRMAQEGLFDFLRDDLFYIWMDRYGEDATDKLLIRRVVNEKNLKDEESKLAKLLETLETGEDLEKTAGSMKTFFPALLDEGILPKDIERAEAIIERYLYSANETAEEAAMKILNEYAESAAELLITRARWLRANGLMLSALSDAYRALDFRGLEKASPLYKELVKERFVQIGFPTEAAKFSPKEKRDKYFNEMFSDDGNIFVTERVVAKADRNALIRIRFLEENEEAYGEVLDFLNGLLEKGYAKLYGGYAIKVHFIDKPVFMPEFKQSKLYGYRFPKNTCHAFFARAIEYPALHQKIIRYAKLATVAGHRYLDLDIETTYPGTFAAAALALCDEHYTEPAKKLGLVAYSEDAVLLTPLMVAQALAANISTLPETLPIVTLLAATNRFDFALKLPKNLVESAASVKSLVLLMDEMRTKYLFSQNEIDHMILHGFFYLISKTDRKIKTTLKEYRDNAESKEDKALYVHLLYSVSEPYVDQFYRVSSKSGNSAFEPTIVYKEEKPLEQYLDDNAVVPANDIKKSKKNIEIDEHITEKCVIFFSPDAMCNPYYFYQMMNMDEVWKQVAGGYPKDRTRYYERPYRTKRDITSSWGGDRHGLAQYGKWVVDTGVLAYQYGVLLFDGKNKPVILAGLYDMARIGADFFDHPDLSEKNLKRLIKQSLLLESDRTKEYSEREAQAFKELDFVRLAFAKHKYFRAKAKLDTYKPEDGDIYVAALMMKAYMAENVQDHTEMMKLYQALRDLQPEYADFWEEKLIQVRLV